MSDADDKWDEELNGLFAAQDKHVAELEEEVSLAHLWLDERGAPRTDEHGTLSLVGRMNALRNGS